MKYTVNYIENEKVVGVKINGRLNFKIAEQYSKEALKLARQNDCTKFLFDHTETIMQVGSNQIHASGEELQQFGFKNTDRIAIVIADHGDDSNLLDPINQNSRWSTLKYFYSDSIKNAFDWLSEAK
jgi:hypothetical protein